MSDTRNSAAIDSELLKRKKFVLKDELNDTWSAYPRHLCIDEIFKNQAANTPANVALVFGDTQVSYQALDEASDRLAGHIIAQGKGSRVAMAVCIDRSPQMLVAILAILKTGAAYVPLDLDYPIDRIRYMIEDADCQLVIGTTRQLAPLAGCGRASLNLDELPSAAGPAAAAAPFPRQGNASDVAYVMYTSGTTGRPKGVAVLHYNISRLVLNTNYVDISEKDVFLQLSSIAFDASTFEIWGALLNGARLVLYDRPHVDLRRIESVIRQNGVSILWMSAGLFNQVAEADAGIFRSVKQLLVGGDVLSVSHVKKVAEANPGCQLINGYGPTECTTFSVCFRITRESLVGTSIPIGRPISNSQAYILDEELRPVPRGEAGELFIGGDGLSRGYLGAAKLTTEKFVTLAFDGALKRLYRTGDLARLGEDGNIYFLGRADRQLKIRGFRVEPAEVEHALLACPGISQAVVLASAGKPGDKRLVAYVVGVSGAVPASLELRRILQKSLPPYMVPATFVYLDRIPLTANGKVNRDLLPKPQWLPLTAMRAECARTPMEKAIERIWSRVLAAGRESRVDENLSAAGGTDGHLAQLVREIDSLYSVNLAASDFEPHQTTIATLVNRIRAELHEI